MSTIHAMEVTIEPNGWRPSFVATCSDTAADCHYVCAEGCESWGEIVRNEDGRVMGHSWDDRDVEALHHMDYAEECNYIAWFDNADDVTEDMAGKPFTFTIPAEFTYDIDTVTWEATA